MNDSEMIFSIVIWLVIIASLIYLLIRKIIKEENEDFENRDYWLKEQLMNKGKFSVLNNPLSL